MNKFNVKAGYYEWMIFREDTLICTIDDGSNSLAESVTAPDGEGLISVDDLYDLSVECLAGIRLAAQEDGAKIPFAFRCLQVGVAGLSIMNMTAAICTPVFLNGQKNLKQNIPIPVLTI